MAQHACLPARFLLAFFVLILHTARELSFHCSHYDSILHDTLDLRAEINALPYLYLYTRTDSRSLCAEGAREEKAIKRAHFVLLRLFDLMKAKIMGPCCCYSQHSKHGLLHEPGLGTLTPNACFLPQIFIRTHKIISSHFNATKQETETAHKTHIRQATAPAAHKQFNRVQSVSEEAEEECRVCPAHLQSPEPISNACLIALWTGNSFFFHPRNLPALIN